MDTTNLDIYLYYYAKTNSLVLSLNNNDADNIDVFLLTPLSVYRAKQILENSKIIPKDKIKVIIDANLKHLQKELFEAMNVSQKQFYTITQMKEKLDISEKEFKNALENKRAASVFISKYMEDYLNAKDGNPDEKTKKVLLHIFEIFETYESEDYVDVLELDKALNSKVEAKKFIERYEIKASRLERRNNALNSF